MPANAGATNGSNQKDKELEDLVRDAIKRYATLRVWDHALQIQANDGVITLAGHVRTTPGKETAERIVRGVQGVTRVVNRVWIDTDLEVAVGRALAENTLTGGS
ncbi:MAG: BON domain-containing protein, partial [Rudaea sp.]